VTVNLPGAHPLRLHRPLAVLAVVLLVWQALRGESVTWPPGAATLSVAGVLLRLASQPITRIIRSVAAGRP
jgi:hypothetical protein